MVFFGSRSKVVNGQQLDGIECEHCGQHQHVSFGVLKYFHIYWIPTFMTSKTVGLECTHCKRTLTDKEIPSHIFDQIKSSVFTKTNTIPMFSGLIIFMVILCLGFYWNAQDEKMEQTYIQKPLLNDIYIVNLEKVYDNYTEPYKYCALKIISVSDTEIECRLAKIAYTGESGVNDDIRNGKTSTDDYFEEEVFTIKIDKIPELKSDGTIVAVERI